MSDLYRQNYPLRHRGFSMIELMVALVLGLLVVLAVLQIFLGASKTYKMTEDMGRIQENGRFAIEYLKRDIRQGGFFGCLQNLSGSQVHNHVNNGDDKVEFNFTEGVSGAEGSWITKPVDGETRYLANVAPDLAADSILLTGGGWGGDSPIKVLQDSGKTLKVSVGADFKLGDVVVVTDCKEADIVMRTPTSGGSPGGFGGVGFENFGHNPGSEIDGLSNDNEDLIGDYVGDQVTTALKLSNNWFEVRENTAGEPALYRNYYIDPDDGSVDAEELVEGIESMQFLYGVASGADRSVTSYQTIDNVSNLEDIVSVKISLVARGLADNITDQSVSFTLPGDNQTYIANDRRLRKVFTSTVAIRNRLD